MTAFFELSNVTKNFGGVQAVSSMSFSIAKGELTGLMGPNGAGKTTIFNLISGVYDPDEGSILFKGEDLVPLKTYQVTSRGIARTFQNLRLFQRSTVLENIMTSAQYHIHYSFAEGMTHLGRWRRTEKEIHEKRMDLLSRVGIADRAEQAAGTLPYGHQRRLELVRGRALDRAHVLGLVADELARD